MVRSAQRLTTKSRYSTILISIRPNTVNLTNKNWNVNTESIVHSLTQIVKFPLNFFINFKRTWTSTCSILKQCGVLTMRMIIKEINASMLIIGKILEENPNLTYIKALNAKTGVLKKLLTNTKKDVVLNLNVVLAMDGKNRNIIQTTSSLISVNIKMAV